ncbi:MAG: nucleotide sugar dehydrogenase [Candidatus Bathyarchaeota archaeon]|nr:nucleotide sugar dehydrogenase [Candidatus Bathyarchaeota archaeon]
MSSSILYIKPEEIDTIEKRGKYTVSVVGCGQIGVLYACLFAEAGFKVKCADADQTIVNSILRGKMPLLKREIELKLKNYVKTGLLNAMTDAKTAVSQSDVITITVPVEIDEKKKANYSNLENTCRRVGSGLRRGSLVVVMSTVGVGVTQGLVKEVLENTSGFKVGADFGLAYSPIRLLNGQTLETLANQERIVAATDKNSLNAASTILGTVTKGCLRKTECVKTAEAVTLFEAMQQDVNVALANELALFCEKVGVDYLEAHKLAKIGAYPVLSLPTLVDGNIREDSYLLLEDSENLNLKLRVPAIAREINEEIVKHAVNLTKDALRNCGKTLRRARISLLGILQIPNMKSSPKKMVEELAKMLEARGAKVSVYDPYFSSDEMGETQYHLKKNLSEALEGVDCILILTGHDQFKRLNLKKLKALMKMPAAIVDLEGIVEPNKVEKEGFTYRGLGRGVWTK